MRGLLTLAQRDPGPRSAARLHRAGRRRISSRLYRLDNLKVDADDAATDVPDRGVGTVTAMVVPQGFGR